MTWDWSSPIAIGIFAVLIGVGAVLVCSALAILAGRAKVADLRLFRW